MMDLRANSLGQESKGAGSSVATAVWCSRGERLHFFMFLPKRDQRVRLDGITEITFTKSHLGVP